jgi:hypothetical protein
MHAGYCMRLRGVVGGGRRYCRERLSLAEGGRPARALGQQHDTHRAVLSISSSNELCE